MQIFHTYMKYISQCRISHCAQVKYATIFMLMLCTIVHGSLQRATAQTTLSSLSFTEVDHIASSNASALTIYDNYAYIGNTNKLSIVDTRSNELISETTLPATCTIEFVHIATGFAFIGCGGLHVLNIQELSKPFQIKYIPSTIKDIALTNTQVYLATGSAGLQVIDTYDAKKCYTWGSNVTAVEVDETHVYVLNNNNISILGPNGCIDPTEKGSYQTQNTPKFLAVEQTYAYVAAENQLDVVNVSEPYTPTLHHTFSFESIKDLKTDAQHAYVLDDYGLTIIAISDPDNMSRFPLYSDIDERASMIQVVNNTVYVLTDNGVELVNIEQPDAPTIQATISMYNPRAMQAEENYIYMLTKYGFCTFDTQTPDDPTQVGQFLLNTTGNAQNIHVADEYTYILNKDTFDIVTTNDLSLVGRYQSLNSAMGFDAIMHLAFVADGEKGVKIIDMSDKQNPTLQGSFPTTGNTNDIVVQQNNAYIAAGDDGLTIIDISNPVTPTLKSTFSTEGSAVAVTVQDSVAYVGSVMSMGDFNFVGYIEVIDVSNPNNPQRQEVIEINPGYIRDIVLDDTTLYVAAGNLITIPLDTLTQTQLQMSGEARAVQVIDNIAYVAADEYLETVDISTPTSPRKVGTWHNEHCHAMDVQAVATGDARQIFLACDSGGLITLEQRGEPTPLESFVYLPLVIK